MEDVSLETLLEQAEQVAAGNSPKDVVNRCIDIMTEKAGLDVILVISDGEGISIAKGTADETKAKRKAEGFTAKSAVMGCLGRGIMAICNFLGEPNADIGALMCCLYPHIKAIEAETKKFVSGEEIPEIAALKVVNESENVGPTEEAIKILDMLNKLKNIADEVSDMKKDIDNIDNIDNTEEKEGNNDD